MTQTSQTMVDQSFNASVGGGSIETVNASRFLLLTAEAAVSKALGSADPTREIGSRGEADATGNRSDSLGNHTWKSGVADQVVSLPPPTVPVSRMVTLRALQE